MFLYECWSIRYYANPLSDRERDDFELDCLGEVVDDKEGGSV